MSRSLSHRLALAMAALGAVAGMAQPAHAYVRESSNWNPGALPVTYYVNQSTIPASLGTTAGVAAVDAGFTTWSGPSCTTWRATDAGNTSTTANTGDGRNVILWVSGTWPAELGSVSSVIGVTTPVWFTGGYFADADIRFNNVGFRWSSTGGTGSTVDTQSIATHEEGHFLGLDHTTVRGAIMYPSYSGGLVRTLSSDDQAGVCAIYPSGVAPTDAGMPMGTDPCNAHGTTCSGCTPYDGCGFCGATSECMSGAQTGPTGGSCASGWAWFTTDCSGGMAGTGRFGDPCTQPTDCGSGGLCVGDGTGAAFCSRACTDDCGCPSGYQCYATSDPTLRVCGPGTNSCSMGTDAGTTPGTDAAVTPGDDAAVTPGDDAAVTPGTDGGGAANDAGSDAGRRSNGGCGCVAAGAGERGPAGGVLLALAGLALVIARRRR